MNASSSSLPAARARVWWKRLSAALNGGVPGSWPVASSIAACSSAAVLLPRVGGRQPRERHLQEHARVQQLRERDALRGEHHRDRLADVAAHALAGRAGDEDPARAAASDADQVRGGEQPQAFAQRRARDPELRRQLLLGADPVPRLQALALQVAADLQRDLV